MTTLSASRKTMSLPMLLRGGMPVAGVVATALVLFAPLLGLNDYWARTVLLIAILSLQVSGLNIVLGYAGELAVGQVFLYAVGAYVTGYLGVTHGITDVGLIMACAIACAIVVGLITGIPGLRLGGWSLAMLTFFLVLIIPNLVKVLESYTGGTNGLAPPVPTLFGTALSRDALYMLIIAVTAVWFLIARNMILSRHGNAFLVLKQSPVLASSLGISVFRLKLLVYVTGAIPACLAGVMFAWLDGFIAPETFTFTLALSILAASIVGGSTSIYGALAGAAIVQMGQQSFNSFQEWQLIIYGVFLLVAGILLADGLTGLARKWLRWAARRFGFAGFMAAAPAPADGPASGPAKADVGALPGVRLRTEGLSKAFGGNRALREVSIDAEPGQVTALIGPNASGKTTLLNLVCGFYRPTAGAIRLGDRDLGGLRPYGIARAGIARTFQTPLIPSGMTTRDFVATGRYISHRVRVPSAVLRLPGFRRGYAADDAEAVRLLGLLGIADVAGQEVDSLPLGTRRLVEVARALAARPAVFLFDEVGSGLDEGDLAGLERAIGLIRDAGGTVVLVEHNFPLVLKLADRIHVLSQGGLLVSGTPAEIQADPRVLEEYTGSKAAGQTGQAGPSEESSGGEG
ncbi:ATP-binding cassette domain-containing protein [Actinomadura sp. 1N219]|uniref:branched-chain amino acid ABC transporter ATP-binding protein/permease n=1 Tax=Actinomadura sp. 1N219 TaxID=3375152 RepID=UPI0037AE2711